MQKRTNPLELKVESKDYTPAPVSALKEPSENKAESAVQTPPIAPPPVTPVISEATAATVENAPQVHNAPIVEPIKAEAHPPVASPEIKEDKPAVVQSVPAAAPVAPTAPTYAKASVLTERQPLPTGRVAPVRPNRPAPQRPVHPNAADDKIRRGEQVADNDVSVAVKFRVAGDRVDRRMVLARVSKDVCKLAQALYPEQSLGSIIESALLTRAFLQDRAAFDAMAREIIEKGGKIKC